MRAFFFWHGYGSLKDDFLIEEDGGAIQRMGGNLICENEKMNGNGTPKANKAKREHVGYV